MTAHASTERLSLYLDGILPSAERQLVEDHVEGCADCRHRLDGLRLVVAGLSRLPAALPPDDLAARVGREIDLRGRGRAWPGRLASRLPSPLAGAPPLHVLALVLALGAIVYLFAFGVEQRRERPTRIVLPSAETTAPAPSGAARQPGPGAAERSAAERLYLLGGVFTRVQGVWVEEGLGQRAADERFALRPVPQDDPELAALAELGEPLRFRVGELAVEVDLSAGP